MIILLKIFYGFLLISGGILIIKYRKIIYEWTGRMAWAEKYLGSGGTVVFITFMGLFLIFLGITYPAGMYDSLTKNNNVSNIEKIENTSGESEENNK